MGLFIVRMMSGLILWEFADVVKWICTELPTGLVNKFKNCSQIINYFFIHNLI